MKPLVLIIDNDLAFREVLRDDLLRTGFYAFIANAGTEISSTLQRLRPDALLISADLADELAFAQISCLRQIPQVKNLPIIMYSASTELADKARGLEAGADDFVSKPFSINDFVGRIQGLLRHGSDNANADVVQTGDLLIDMSGYSVTYRDMPIELSQTMFSILCLLARQPDRAFTREQIRNAVWGESAIYDRSVDVYMNRLRLSMGNEAGEMIKTVRGIGYKLLSKKMASVEISVNTGNPPNTRASHLGASNISSRRESDRKISVMIADNAALAF
jgi:DNA-binding response OmpR family regulator